MSLLSPSRMTWDELESTFVQREDLLQAMLEQIGSNALTSEKKNLLLAGPRGIGKTHLISLLYYRLKDVKELKDHLLIAWLRDEEWCITSFRDLLVKILCSLLAQVYGDKAAEQRVTPIRALEPKDAEAAAANLIRELVGNRTLVILVENIDDLIQKLGSIGGIQLSHFLQEYRFCCMIATSPSTNTRVMLSGSPFPRDFFQIQQLQELSIHDAGQLISKIAQSQRDKDLKLLLATARGRARVRALRYLAGGNHRAYVVFTPLLTQDSLSHLIRLLGRTIENLTPFYSTRIAGLAPEQSKIIEFVCESRHPVQMADVSQACSLAPASALTQLDSLCKMGYLQSFKIRDARYYELRELLMRLSVEVIKHRDKPISLLADFLRLWFSPVESKRMLAGLPVDRALEQDHIPPVRLMDQNDEDPAIAANCREYNTAVQKSDFDRALRAVEGLSSLRDLNEDRMAQTYCLMRAGRPDHALAVCNQMVASNRGNAAVWQMRAWILNGIGLLDEALSSSKKSIELGPEASAAWSGHAFILLRLNNPKESLSACEKAIALNRGDALAWYVKGIALAVLERFEEAVPACSKAIELDPHNLDCRIQLCAALIELNRGDEALGHARRAIESDPEQPRALILLGTVLAHLKHCDEALTAFNKAISSGADSPFVRYKVVEVLLALDRWREGMEALDKSLGQFSNSENFDAGNTGALIRCLLPNLFAPRILQLSIRLLFLTYQKHRMLGALGQGLFDCIPDVVSSTALSDSDVGLWRNSWQVVAERFPEFRLPLRLLDSATRYRKTRDLRIFMDLPQEERKLLEQLTGVALEMVG